MASYMKRINVNIRTEGKMDVGQSTYMFTFMHVFIVLA
jgi:hypothetical protein